MSVISMKQLLEAGVHFGHQTRRWNPKMAEYIYTERNGIYIIDLQKSVGKVDEAYKAVLDCAANGGKILFDLYAQTGDERYKIAMDTLRKQMAEQPRTSEGGFWHKFIYPH